MNRKSILFRALAKLGIIQHFARSQRAAVSSNLEVPSTLDSFEWETSLSNPTKFYLQCTAFFDLDFSGELKAHRAYYSQKKRGFGEDAFHVMWAMLIAKFKPTEFLEIGVYRGQVLSLVLLLQKLHNISGTVTGIGPFERLGDAASVVNYGHCEDWLGDTLVNFNHFQLSQPQLLKALSTDTAATTLISSKQWDMIYIDGNHDYEVVVEDWENCSQSVKVGGIIVLDDSGLESGFRAPLFASEGFPGPSRIANSVEKEGRFKEVLQVGHNRAFQRLQ